MAKANPTEELIRFLLFVFWLPTAHSARAWGAEGAHYVRRGGKENAVREAEARTAETSRSAATTAGSQVQNTGVIFQGWKNQSLLLTSQEWG